MVYNGVNPIQNGWFGGIPYFWKHPLIHPWRFNGWNINPWRFGAAQFSLNKMGDGCRFQPFIFQSENLGQQIGWRLTWNLQITHLERKMIFQTSMRTCSMLIFQGSISKFPPPAPRCTRDHSHCWPPPQGPSGPSPRGRTGRGRTPRQDPRRRGWMGLILVGVLPRGFP